MSGPPAIAVQGVVKSFRERAALAGVSIRVERGDVYGLLGRNGAGKTTLFRILLDVLRPDQGSIEILGGPPGPELRRRMGYLPEDRGQDPDQRVGEVLVHHARLRGLAAGDARARTARWLDRLGLPDVARQKFREISKGMHQRVHLAAALLHDPDLLILDEPFSGLDPSGRNEILGILHERAQAGVTVLLSSHLVERIEGVASRIGILERGTMAIEGRVDEVAQRFHDRTFRVGYAGGGEPGIESSERATRVDGQPLFRVRLPEGLAPARFLAGEIAAGREVLHFEPCLPSLEEIFLRVVGTPDRPEKEEGGRS